MTWCKDAKFGIAFAQAADHVGTRGSCHGACCCRERGEQKPSSHFEAPSFDYCHAQMLRVGRGSRFNSSLPFAVMARKLGFARHGPELYFEVRMSASACLIY